MNLVTGATGILGSHVALSLLQNGQEVKAARRANSDLNKVKRLFALYNASSYFEKIQWVELDIRDIFSIEDALEGVTNVYHCAGYVSFEKRDRKKLKQINEEGTRNVVNACLTKKTPVLCFASSVATINNSDYQLPLTEDVFWKTSGRESDYAISKYNAEREVWRGMEEGLNVVIVNPGVILSPVFWTQSSARMFETCYKGNPFYTEGMASYVSAMDVAQVMIKLVKEQHYGNRYIVVEGSYSYKTIFSEIQKSFHKRAPFIRLEKWMLSAARYLEGSLSLVTGRKRVVTSAIVSAAFNKQIFSGEKLKKTLSHVLLPTSDSIKMICEFYLSEKVKGRSSV